MYSLTLAALHCLFSGTGLTSGLVQPSHCSQNIFITQSETTQILSNGSPFSQLLEVSYLLKNTVCVHTRVRANMWFAPPCGFWEPGQQVTCLASPFL